MSVQPKMFKTSADIKLTNKLYSIDQIKELNSNQKQALLEMISNSVVQAPEKYVFKNNIISYKIDITRANIIAYHRIFRWQNL